MRLLKRFVASVSLLALGLAAWKVIPGDRWALRCNPSSGNLHPTEGYVALGPEAGVAAPLRRGETEREQGGDVQAGALLVCWRRHQWLLSRLGSSRVPLPSPQW